MSEQGKRMFSRLAAIGLMLALAGGVVAFLFIPFTDEIATQRDQIAAKRELLGRLESFAAQKERLNAVAAEARGAVQSGIFFSGETDALRSVNLQAIITSIAGESNVRLASVRTLPARQTRGLTLIGVEAEMDADIGQFQSMILGLESHRPHLFIDTLHVTPVALRRADSDLLNIRLAIFGAVANPEMAAAQ